MNRASRLGSTVLMAGLCSTLPMLSGCSVDLPKSDTSRVLIPHETQQAGLAQMAPPITLSVGNQKHKLAAKRLSLNMADTKLVTLFDVALPGVTLEPQDAGVNLRKKVSVQLHDASVASLLRQLSVSANYAFRIIDGSHVAVQSSMTKVWNLAALSAARVSKGDVGDTDNSTSSSSSSSSSTYSNSSNSNSMDTGGLVTTLQNDEDEWDHVVETAKAMLGIKGKKNSRDTATLTAIRSLGTIQATGEPRDVMRLDRWLSHLADLSTKQVHLDVKTMEVRLNDSKARGINWQALINGSIKQFGVSSVIGFNADTDTADFDSSSAGLNGSINGTNTSGNQDFSAVFNFLSKYGTVKLLNEPNVTVTNGRTANITTGQRYSYIASVSQAYVDGGSVINTPDIQSVLVGVKLAVTPRVLPDNRILVNVVPVITSLQGFDEFKVADMSVSNPNIALQSLATQVITKPGQPINIGGLIGSKIAGALNSLPVRKEAMPDAANWLFSAESNSIDRHELVITITPTFVNP